MNLLEVDCLAVRYGGSVVALEDVSLSVGEGGWRYSRRRCKR
jgi:hypothetical protein